MAMDRRNIGVEIRWHLVHLLVPDPNVAANHEAYWTSYFDEITGLNYWGDGEFL